MRYNSNITKRGIITFIMRTNPKKQHNDGRIPEGDVVVSNKLNSPSSSLKPLQCARSNEYEQDGGVPQTGVMLLSDPYAKQIALTDGVRRSGEVAEKIVAEGNKFRAAHPFIFHHQDAIGFAIFTVSVAAIIFASSWYYGVFYRAVANANAGWSSNSPSVGWWSRFAATSLAVMIHNAFWMSILHELEHDLIHFMYFRKHPLLHNFMMFGIWVLRPNSSSGWVRRRMHLHHHRVSGTASDLEERAITNGCPWGFKRLIMTGDHILAWMLRLGEMRDVQRRFLHAQPDLTTRRARERVGYLNLLSLFPLGNLFYVTWHAFLLWHVIRFVMPNADPASFLSDVDAATIPPWVVVGLLQPDPVHTPRIHALDNFLHYVAVVMFIPSFVRVFSLQFVSSNMHYCGDVEAGNVLQQTQVWTSWWVAPFHFFCFNFGGTHAIHHFVARETFYVRQLTASRMYPILKAYGVRFNDFGSLWRANRRGPTAVPQQNA
jgi:hypothetical protein